MHVHDCLLGNTERICDCGDVARQQISVVHDYLHLALQPSEMEEQPLLLHGRTDLHQ
jgi:hypothetical protein